METNRTTNWPEGLRFIQVMKNRAMHHGIKCSPYEAMFGHPMKAGLKTSNLPDNLVTNLNTEEELEELISSVSSSTNQEGESDSDVREDERDQDVVGETEEEENRQNEAETGEQNEARERKTDQGLLQGEGTEEERISGEGGEALCSNQIESGVNRERVELSVGHEGDTPGTSEGGIERSTDEAERPSTSAIIVSSLLEPADQVVVSNAPEPAGQEQGVQIDLMNLLDSHSDLDSDDDGTHFSPTLLTRKWEIIAKRKLAKENLQLQAKKMLKMFIKLYCVVLIRGLISLITGFSLWHEFVNWHYFNIICFI